MTARRLTDEAYWCALEEASTAKGVLRAATAGPGWEKRRRPADGATPWMVVLEKGFQSQTMAPLCKRMFEKGIDFTAEDRFGRTFWAWALHYGIEEPSSPSRVKVEVEIPYMEPNADPTVPVGMRQAYLLVAYTWLDMLHQKVPDMRNRAGEGVLVQLASHHPQQANWALASAHCLEELRDRVPGELAFTQEQWLAGSSERQARAGHVLFETSLAHFIRDIPGTTNTVRTRSSRGLTETLGVFPWAEGGLEGVEPTLATATRLAGLVNTWLRCSPQDPKFETVRKGLMEHAPLSWWESGALKAQFAGGFSKARGWTQWVESMVAQMRARQLDESLPDPHTRAAKPRF